MISNFSVRVADLRDMTAVNSLLAASYSKLLQRKYGPQMLARALPIITKANPVLLASGTYYLTQIGGVLVGCGGWSKEAPGSGELKGGMAHIRHFATHPDWLRRGIARTLLLRCFREASMAGISSLECHSSSVAVDFYLATGFRVVGPMEMKLTPHISIDGVLMRRSVREE
jgi:N-acetylglutamate synthase-like GNAT family acetyltransferase